MAYAHISEQDRIATPNLNYVWNTNTMAWAKMEQPLLNAGSVTVSGTVTIQDGGNSITVDGPLTDAQLRAAPVVITGAVITL